jgi:hypothetical protein
VPDITSPKISEVEKGFGENTIQNQMPINSRKTWV